MKKRKTSLLALVVTCVLLFLTGCSPMPTQLHERLIVQGIGIDIKEDKYLITMQVFDTQNGGGGDPGAAQDQITVVSAEGKSVLDAFNSITLQTGKEPLYSQNLILLIGEQAAKAGLSHCIDFFIRYYEARPNVNLFIAKGKASDIMNSEAKGQLTLPKNIEMLADSGELNASTKKSTVLSVVKDLRKPYSSSSAAVLSLQDTENEAVVVSDGIALFSGDKLTGYLDREETTGLLLATGQVQRGTTVINVPNAGRVTYSFMGSQSEITANIQNNLPQFTIDVSVDANIFELDSESITPLPNEYFTVFADELEAHVKAMIEDTVHTALDGYGCDVFSFGRTLKKNQPDYFKGIEDNWFTIMKQAQYTVNVTAVIKRIGQEVNPL